MRFSVLLSLCLQIELLGLARAALDRAQYEVVAGWVIAISSAPPILPGPFFSTGC